MLTLCRNVDECEPLLAGLAPARPLVVREPARGQAPVRRVEGRGLHSVHFKLNLSRVRHTKTPYTPYTPQTPPNTPLTCATQLLNAPSYPIKSAQVELGSERVYAPGCRPRTARRRCGPTTACRAPMGRAAAQGLTLVYLRAQLEQLRTHSLFKLGHTVDRRAQVSLNGKECKPLLRLRLREHPPRLAAHPLALSHRSRIPTPKVVPSPSSDATPSSALHPLDFPTGWCLHLSKSLSFRAHRSTARWPRARVTRYPISI